MDDFVNALEFIGIPVSLFGLWVIMVAMEWAHEKREPRMGWRENALMRGALGFGFVVVLIYLLIGIEKMESTQRKQQTMQSQPTQKSSSTLDSNFVDQAHAQ
jgi:hypothetical protein